MSRVRALVAMSDAQREWAARTGAVRAWPLVAAVLLAMLVLPTVIASVWPRMALVESVATLVALTTVRLPWRELLRVRPRALVLGVLAGFALWLAGALFVELLRALAPARLAELPTIYIWRSELPPALAIVATLAIVVGEDIVWRGVVTLRAVASFGPVLGCVLAGMLFALAHVTSGPPLLWLAALLCGTLWSLATVLWRSLVPVIAMHASWDILVMFVWRYA